MKAEASAVYEALRKVIDPEVGVNIVDLGLVYCVHREAKRIAVKMTLSTPACPMGESLVGQAREALRDVAGEGVEVSVELVREPEWTPERMTDRARKTLGW